LISEYYIFEVILTRFDIRFLMNHTSVWGSWWHEGKWGYQCCHSTIKSSYCTGQAGIEASQSGPLAIQEQSGSVSTEDRSVSEEQVQDESTTSLLDQYVKRAAAGQLPSASSTGVKEKKRRLGEGEIELDPKKLKEAIEREKTNTEIEGDRKYNSMKDHGEVTQEELEAYRMHRKRTEDPMANYVDKGDGY
jgi:pre-mRNA-processing factor SLU7